jgi:hypothetical protein
MEKVISNTQLPIQDIVLEHTHILHVAYALELNICVDEVVLFSRTVFAKWYFVLQLCYFIFLIEFCN